MLSTLEQLEFNAHRRTRKLLTHPGARHTDIFDRIAARRESERASGTMIKSKAGDKRQPGGSVITQREHSRGLEKYLDRAATIGLITLIQQGRLEDDEIDTWERLVMEEELSNNTAEPEDDGDLPFADPITLDPINERYGVVWLPARSGQSPLGGYLFSAPVLLTSIFRNRPPRNPLTRDPINADVINLIQYVDAQGDPNFPVIDEDEPVDYPALFKAIAKAYLDGVESWSYETRGERERAVIAMQNILGTVILPARISLAFTDGSTADLLVFSPSRFRDVDNVSEYRDEGADIDRLAKAAIRRMNAQRAQAARIAARIAAQSENISGRALDEAGELAANNVAKLVSIDGSSYQLDPGDELYRAIDLSIQRRLVRQIVEGNPPQTAIVKLDGEEKTVWLAFFLGNGEFRLQTADVNDTRYASDRRTRGFQYYDEELRMLLNDSNVQALIDVRFAYVYSPGALFKFQPSDRDNPENTLVPIETLDSESSGTIYRAVRPLIFFDPAALPIPFFDPEDEATSDIGQFHRSNQLLVEILTHQFIVYGYNVAGVGDGDKFVRYMPGLYTRVN